MSACPETLIAETFAVRPAIDITTDSGISARTWGFLGMDRRQQLRDFSDRLFLEQLWENGH